MSTEMHFEFPDDDDGTTPPPRQPVPNPPPGPRQPVADPQVKFEHGDETLTIDLDVGSFNRAERRQLQDRFGQNFEALVATVRSEIFSKEPAGKVIRGLDGKTIFADEVLISMLTITRQRIDPTATEEIFDNLSLEDLVMATVRGRTEGPKDSTTST